MPMSTLKYLTTPLKKWNKMTGLTLALEGSGSLSKLQTVHGLHHLSSEAAEMKLCLLQKSLKLVPGMFCLSLRHGTVGLQGVSPKAVINPWTHICKNVAITAVVYLLLPVHFYSESCMYSNHQQIQTCNMWIHSTHSDTHLSV